MISKIEINGESRLAIILDKHNNFEDLLNYQNALIDLINLAHLTDIPNGKIICDTVFLLQQLMPTTDQNIAAEVAYFGRRFPITAKEYACTIQLTEDDLETLLDKGV